MRCFHAAAHSAAALHLPFLGLVLMATAMFMREAQLLHRFQHYAQAQRYIALLDV